MEMGGYSFKDKRIGLAYYLLIGLFVKSELFIGDKTNTYDNEFINSWQKDWIIGGELLT